LSGLRRAPLDEQLAVFNEQLDLACLLQRPCSIHCIDAWSELHQCLGSRELPEAGFLLHAYAGPVELVKSFASLGAYFSFNGSYLEPKRKRIRLAYKEVPHERLLIETDAPAMLPPLEWRAKQSLNTSLNDKFNQPANIVPIYAGLAEYLGVPIEALCAQVAANYKALFIAPLKQTPLKHEA
jgi:TatD DNase family protein